MGLPDTVYRVADLLEKSAEIANDTRFKVVAELIRALQEGSWDVGFYENYMLDGKKVKMTLSVGKDDKSGMIGLSVRRYASNTEVDFLAVVIWTEGKEDAKLLKLTTPIPGLGELWEQEAENKKSGMSAMSNHSIKLFPAADEGTIYTDVFELELSPMGNRRRIPLESLMPVSGREPLRFKVGREWLSRGELFSHFGNEPKRILVHGMVLPLWPEEILSTSEAYPVAAHKMGDSVHLYHFGTKTQLVLVAYAEIYVYPFMWELEEKLSDVMDILWVQWRYFEKVFSLLGVDFNADGSLLPWHARTKVAEELWEEHRKLITGIS